MRVTVTGGAGYIGSHTARLLAELGHDVLIYDNLSTGHLSSVQRLESRYPRLHFQLGDIGDFDGAASAVRDADCVVHFAACLDVAESVREPLKYYATNVAGTLTLLQAVRQGRCRTLVFSSSCATYGQPKDVPITEATPTQPISPYGRTKWMVEQMLMDCGSAWGLGSTSLRYFNVAGASHDGLLGEEHEPEVHLIPRVLMALDGKIPYVEICGTDYDTRDGTCIRDYLHVEDIAAAHALMLTRTPAGRFQAYNLGTGTGTSVKEIVEAAERVTGQTCPVREVARRPGDPAKVVASAELLEREHGWRAQFTQIDDMISSAWLFRGRGTS